jgi:hypothetical protein
MKRFFFFLLIAGAVAFSAGGFDAVESVAREQEAATTDSTGANTPKAPAEPTQEEPGSNTDKETDDESGESPDETQPEKPANNPDREAQEDPKDEPDPASGQPTPEEPATEPKVQPETTPDESSSDPPPTETAKDPTKQTAEDAPDKNEMGISGKIWTFIQFAVITGLVFVALWFGLPMVISRWRELKAETTSVSTTPPKVVQPSAPQSACAQEEESLSPEWPKLKGARPRAHYLANNFTTQQLRVFLADLEASRENRPDSPYASWGTEEIDRFTSDVRSELADRTR